MRDTHPTPSQRPDSYFVVTEAHASGAYTVENDYAWLDPDAQWNEIVSLVATGEWQDVIGCDYVHRKNVTCEDRLIKLANAVDNYYRDMNRDPHDDIRDWIEAIIGDEAFMTDATRARIAEEQRVDYAIDIARGK